MPSGERIIMADQTVWKSIDIVPKDQPKKRIKCVKWVIYNLQIADAWNTREGSE